MPVSSGCFLHYPFLPFKFHCSTLVYQDQGNLASRALVVCVWGGGAGYVKIVMTGMCGPNLASALVKCVWGGGRGWLRQNCIDGDVRT